MSIMMAISTWLSTYAARKQGFPAEQPRVCLRGKLFQVQPSEGRVLFARWAATELTRLARQSSGREVSVGRRTKVEQFASVTGGSESSPTAQARRVAPGLRTVSLSVDCRTLVRH